GGGEVMEPTGTPAIIEREDNRPAIAVLPFDNFSPNPDDAWFADGVHEDITTALSRISAISVPARSSVDQFKDDRPDSRGIASILGVDFLLEGSGRIVGTQMRVSVQLIDGGADRHVWSEEYDVPFSMDEVMRISSGIAQQVAAGVGARIAPSERTAISSLPTKDLVAYRLVHRARTLWDQRTAPEIRQAIDLYEEAIGRDPDYSDAFAGLAEASFFLTTSWDVEEVLRSVRRAVASAERALELDPSAGGAHAVLGLIKLYFERDWEGAEEELATAIGLDPDHAFAHHGYSVYLSALGRHEEALRELSIAQRLDPLAQALSHGPAKMYFQARQFDRAIEEALQNLEANPEHHSTTIWLCRSYLMLERFEEGMQACAAAQSNSEGRSPHLGLYYAMRGERSQAMREVEGTMEVLGSPTLTSVEVFAVLGEVDEAVRTIRYLIDVDPMWPSIRLGIDPFLDPLRSDSRFIQILRDMGLEG
ncbi:tetratricopeptide repeat protein, partial [Gemmatimonadota bacterium]